MATYKTMILHERRRLLASMNAARAQPPLHPSLTGGRRLQGGRLRACISAFHLWATQINQGHSNLSESVSSTASLSPANSWIENFLWILFDSTVHLSDIQ